MTYLTTQSLTNCRFTLSLVSVAAAVWFGSSKPLHAITFNVNYIAGNSTAPAGDLTGALLSSHMQAAANHWADIIEDSWTMEVNFWYGDQADGTIATAAVLPPTGDGKRTIKGEIIFDATPTAQGNPLTYFYDPTPSINEEFDLAQGLYRDLSAADKTAIYKVTAATPLLEESFSGPANISAAQGQFTLDVMSFAYHEFGHLLGVTPQLPNGASQVADNDYDLPAGLLAGHLMAVNSVGSGHVAEGVDGNLLMQDGLLGGRRYLPSATDVLTAASVSEWTQIDLPRQDLLAGSSWNVPGNWEGAQLPGSGDDAYVRLGGTINLDVNDAVQNLFVGSSTEFRTGTNRLDANGTTTIDFDGAFPFARIVVETNGELESGDLVINGAQLDMEGGLADVQDTLVINEVSGVGSIVGFGTVDVQNSLVNNGLISAGNNGTLTITSSNPSAVFDLDGDAGNGKVRAIAGSLVFSAIVGPNFAGDMEVGGGHEISIQNPWTLSPGGTLTLEGNTTAFASANLRGGELTVGGTIDVDKKVGLFVPATITQQAVVNIPDSDDTLELGLQPSQTITLLGGSISGNGSLNANGSVNVPAGRSPVIDVNTSILGPLSVAGDAFFQRNLDLASSSTTTLSNGALQLNGETTFRGGSLTGNGFVFINDVARIVDDQLIDIAGTFDLDGLTNDSQLFVEAGKTLNLQASFIDIGSNDYDGNIRLTNGALLIDVDANVWTMRGELLMTGVGGGGSGVGGDAVDFTGDLIVSGGPTHFFAASSRFLAGSATSVAFGTRLQFNAPVTYSGGTHAIVGEVAYLSSATIDAGASITAVAMEVAPSATLAVNGGNTTVTNFTKLPGGSFDFNGGRFEVSTGTAIFNSSFAYGGLSGANQPTFVVEDGADVVARAWLVGSAAGEHGFTHVTGTNANGSRRSTLRSSSAGDDLRVGDSGTGTLLVEDGGLVSFGDDTEIAREQTASVGVLTVRGVANAGGNLIRSEVDVTRNGSGSSLIVGRAGDGTLNIENGALVRVSGSVGVTSLQNSRGEVNIGGTAAGFSAELDVTGNIGVGAAALDADDSAVFNLNSGGLVTANLMAINPRGTTNFTGGELVLNTLDLTAGGAFIMTGGRLQANDVTGDLTTAGGVVAPGTSPGTTRVTGDFDQSAGGSLEIEIGGLVAGTEFDQFSVDGVALLGGTLDVLLIDGYSPTLGDAFEILTAGSLFDTFQVSNLPALGALGWAINYNPTNVILEIVQPQNGDFDVDFDVDGFDFLKWQRGESPNPLSSTDLAAWEANFGVVGNLTAESTAVPEPGTLMLLACAALTALPRELSRMR